MSDQERLIDAKQSMNLDDHVFDLRIVFQGVGSHLASVTALLVPAERRGGVENVVAVHPHCPRL